MVITSTKATRNNLRKNLERILKSEYYRSIFPWTEKSKYSAERFELGNGCYILFTTSLSTVPTGSGFHFIVASDYVSATWIKSPSTMTTAFQNWEGFMTRKQGDPPTKVIVDNQRLGYYDLSWRIMAGAERQGEKVTRITLPYQFEDDFFLKLPNKIVLPFKRSEYLIERFNDREKRGIISSTSPETYRIQYQQQPVQDKGRIFNRAFFRFYRPDQLESIEFIDGFITTDLAFKRTVKADFTVFMFWLLDKYGNIYLVDMYRDKVEGVGLGHALYTFFQKWRHGDPENNILGCGTTIIETAGNSMFLSQLRNGLPIAEGQKSVTLDCQIKEVIRSSNKFIRARQALSWLQAGRVFLPSYDVKINGVGNINDDIVEPLLKEVDEFSDDDSHRSDDMVDNIIDAINHVNVRSYATYDINVARI